MNQGTVSSAIRAVSEAPKWRQQPRAAASPSQRERRSAILVIHGIGEQKPLQTLDKFARGLLRVLNNRYGPTENGKYRPIHKQVTSRVPDAPEIWLENYVALETKDEKPSIDIYEYYWAHHMTDQVKAADIVQWLKDASSHAGSYYRERDDDRKEEFENRYDKEPQLKNLFEPNGEFHENGYLRHLGFFLRVFIYVYRFLNASVFSRWPIVSALFDAISRKIKSIIINYLGDVVLYTTMDRKSRLYEVRQTIIREAHMQIEALLKSKEYEAVFIAGHSLGSVIAYDVINRLHTYPLQDNDTQKWTEALRGLITFGSPLDKIAFYFREQVAKEAHIRRHMINNLHSFKKPALVDPEIDEKDPECMGVMQGLKNLKEKDIFWINFYDCEDPVSGHLDLYSVDKNQRLKMGEPFGLAHTAYWEDDKMYKRIVNVYSKFLTTANTQPKMHMVD